jgi:hypothetical protein
LNKTETAGSFEELEEFEEVLTTEGSSASARDATAGEPW